jgi:hypothetical protein
VRLASDLAVTCRTSARNKEVGWPGRARDISSAGVGLILQHRFRPGTHLVVELRRGTGAFLLAVAATVVHTEAIQVDGHHCWLLGCTFDEPLSDEELQALK